MWSLHSHIIRLISLLQPRIDEQTNSSSDATYDAPVASRFWLSMLGILERRSALIVLLVFAVIGFLVLDDYAVAPDEVARRNLPIKLIDYVLGRSGGFLHPIDRFFGVAFEMPLLVAERALGIEDSRDIWLMRHILGHLFFLMGGFFCYLLAYRLFDNRLLAVLAMLIFLLHPRLYAHSFFNTKDIPFLSMFMICLYLTHRAFGRGNVWWFAVLGIGVGLLINLRIMGIVLFTAVLAIMVLDFVWASERVNKRQIMLSGGVFVLAVVLTVYGSLPYLWGGPVVRFIEWVTLGASHPQNDYQLFRGELTISRYIHPPEYVPVWILISTPPVILVLGIAGVSVLFLRGLFRPLDVVRDARLRFGVLLVFCFLSPIIAVIVLDINVFNGWRHLYFLYAPLCMLAVFGLHWLMSAIKAMHLRAGIYYALGAGIVSAVIAAVSIHPHQHLYFNFWVDRHTPELLRMEYDIDYWSSTYREGFEHMLELYPAAVMYVSGPLHDHLMNNWSILPENDRRRIIAERDGGGDFYITNHHEYKVTGTSMGIGDPAVYGPLVYSRKIYNSSVLSVVAVDLSNVDEATADLYREHYLSVVSGNEPVFQSEWDGYLDDDTLVYIKSPCDKSDMSSRFFLHFVPLDPSDMPRHRLLLGHTFDNYDFHFGQRGVMFDGKCIASVDLPDYNVASIRTGQWVSGDGNVLWEVDYNILASRLPTVVDELHERGIDPVVRSVFDIYIDEDILVYFKSDCSFDDVDARFFVHVYPVDTQELQLDRTRSGFANLDFDFGEQGLMFDGKCVAGVYLPDYDIARIRTGQWDSEHQRDIWEAEFSVAE